MLLTVANSCYVDSSDMNKGTFIKLFSAAMMIPVVSRLVASVGGKDSRTGRARTLLLRMTAKSQLLRRGPETGMEAINGDLPPSRLLAVLLSLFWRPDRLLARSNPRVTRIRARTPTWEETTQSFPTRAPEHKRTPKFLTPSEGTYRITLWAL